MQNSSSRKIDFTLRSRVATAALLLGFLVIAVRLWYLQILKGEENRERSENNRLRVIYIAPPRGEILARDGERLVKNRPSFDVELVREDCGKECDQTLENLAKILDVDLEELRKRASEQQRKRRKFEPRLLIKDIARDDVAKLAAKKYLLKGLIVSVEPTREYIYGEWGAHVLGYLGEISSDQLKSPDFSMYRSGDIVGKYGVESLKEQLLQGYRGTKGIYVNAAGMRMNDAYYEHEQPGHNVTLTIDYTMQSAAEEAFKELQGALVALNPNTGEVLAMVSKPSFNPNNFIAGISAKEWGELSGPGGALTNKVVQGAYPPGSVFKSFMAVAALSEGVIKPNETVFCGGTYQIGHSRPFGCTGHHGVVDLHNALKRSCNVYFYTVGQRLGVDRINDYAMRFGFNAPTGLELSKEQKGLIPSTEWKKKTYRPPDNKWYPGETPSVSIGQGAVSVTPMQVARAMSALVNGGHVYRPYVVQEVRSQNGTSLFEGEVLEQRNLGVEPWVLDTVKEALVAVVNEEGGTGRRASLKDLDIVVGGKTGTAQIKQMIGTKTLREKDSLAWFAGFAPAENPEVVIAAVVEGGGHGGVTAAPVVKQVMAAYFEKKNGTNGQEDS